MYDFIDRPVAGLSPGGRFLLWAMRGWTQTAARRQCPPGALAPAFARHGVLPALPHLHRLLAVLNRDARGRLALAPLDHCRVVEDEAVLLQLWRDAREAPPRAQATLALLIQPEATGEAFDALLGAAARFADAGLADVSIAIDGVRN